MLLLVATCNQTAHEHLYPILLKVSFVRNKSGSFPISCYTFNLAVSNHDRWYCGFAKWHLLQWHMIFFETSLVAWLGSTNKMSASNSEKRRYFSLRLLMVEIDIFCDRWKKTTTIKPFHQSLSMLCVFVSFFWFTPNERYSNETIV